MFRRNKHGLPMYFLISTNVQQHLTFFNVIDHFIGVCPIQFLVRRCEPVFRIGKVMFIRTEQATFFNPLFMPTIHDAAISMAKTFEHPKSKTSPPVILSTIKHKN